MTTSSLSAALKAIDWRRLEDGFLAKDSNASTVETEAVRIAVWSNQLEAIDPKNDANVFLRAMQMDSIYVAPLLALALYKPAAASMRAMFEAALQYVYFRDHAVEFSTLLRDRGYFLDRRDVMDYLDRHSPGFAAADTVLHFTGRSNVWYKKVSGVVHGGVPGTWIPHSSLAEIDHSTDVLTESLATYAEGVELVHRLFLSTIAQARWADFAHDAKEHLLKGMAGAQREALGLDKA